MKAFRRELQAFLEQLARVGDGLSPLPHLSESSSFLSSVTSVSRDSPVGNSGKELAAELQSQVRGQPEWQPGQDGGDERECPHLRTAREPQRRADGHAGSHRAGGRSRLDLELGQEHLCAVRWKELEAHSLALQGTLQERAWSDERAPLRQELRALKHSVFLFYAKLRWLLKHWRQGTQMEEGAEELAEMEHPGAFPGLAELGVQGGYQVDGTDQCNGDRGDHSPHSPVQIGDHGSRPQCVDGGPPPRQVENQQLLGALGALLEDLRSELREDELARLRLQQQHASDKAAWDVEWAVLKGRLAQLEEKTEKGLGELESCAESRGALRKEREVHQRLLADSHGLVMDLRWQIHRSQRNWDREKVELLERLDRGRRAWEQQRKELLWTIEQLQNENGPQRGKSFLCDQKEGNKRPSPHQGGLRERPLAMWPCGDTDSIPFEDRPLSKLKESDRCSASENLYLDALSLDEEPEETPPRGPERESRKCLPEEEENPRGNLQRAVSVSSMSEFQRLMDVSPFLPEKGPPPASSREDVTPPLSPDDLKYIEEFNGKGWDCTPPRARARTEAPAEPFPDSSWYLTTSVTMTTDTMTSPEHCQKQPPRSHVLAEPSCVRVLHSPPTVRRADSIVPPAGEDPLPASRGRGAPGDARGAHTEPVLGRWACAPSRHPRDCVEGALCSSPLLGLDPKEAAFCVRSAASPGPPRPQVKDMACQTSGSRTTGVQTVPSISVGLQTEALRSGLTSSPHKCLTPKAAGGATPVSSPSRGLRSRQVAPAIAIEKEKAQAKFERTCCSPKYGSPKLQRKPPKAEQPSRASPGAAQKGCSASAWARSTTTRESPVHTTIGDGLSSLFSVIDHGPAVQDAFQKGARPGSHSRPAELRPELGPGQEAASRGRSPSPLGVGAETGREEGGDCTPVRQDLSAPPGYTLAESVARILNKKLLEHALEEQRRQASLGVPGLASDGHAGEMVTAEPGSMENQTVLLAAPWVL